MNHLNCLRGKLILPIILFIFLAIYWFLAKELKSRTTFPASHRYSDNNFTVVKIKEHEEIVKEFYEKRMNWVTSKLGAILFKNEPIPEIYVNGKNPNKKTYLILIYKTWYFLQNRNVHFGPDETNLLKNCSVKNCIFTTSKNMTNMADAIIVHLRRSSWPQKSMADRNPNQRIIFFDDESPPKMLLEKKRHYLSQMVNVFNWSMSYRSDADIPVPYGRTVALINSKLQTNISITTLIPFWKTKKRDVLINTVLTDCNISYKFKILDRWKKYISINIYNMCYRDSLKFEKCERNLECNESSNYLFYLIFENTKCKEYMTEKIFYLAYSKGAIPIIQGPSVEDCKKLLPPNSYIHMDDYRSIKDLAKEIKRINDDEKKLLSYHAWRNHFEVVNEHGYYGTQSQHLCRICQALNYNDNKPSVYRDYGIQKFLNAKFVCRI